MKILVINGPNLNMLGLRDPNIYGNNSLLSIQSNIISEFPEIEFEFKQSNDENQLCEWLHDSNSFDGAIINPGAFTHSSVAIRDAIELLSIPIIEVHLSNITSRENFRKTQLTTSKVNGYISGLKENGYLAAVFILKKVINNKMNSSGV